MGHIFIKTSALSFSGYAIYRVVESADPLVEISRQAFPAPHAERGVTFSPLRPVMHQVQLWESSDGTALDTLRGSLSCDASINNELQVTLIEIEVDRGGAGLVVGDTGDPVAGTGEYLDARMLGQTYTIMERGSGTLKLSEFTDNTSHGGFAFTGGNTFNPGDTFFITIYGSTTVTETETSTDEDVIEESADITLSATHYGKLVAATGTDPLQVFTFPSLAGIPDKTKFSFSTQYGSFNYLKLQFAFGDTVLFNGQTKNAIYLAREERLDCIVKDGIFYIKYYDGRVRQRGQLYGDYMQRTGTLLADGTSYSKADYEGLYDWLLNDAPSALKCTYAAWAASSILNGDTVYLNKGLFAFDAVGETFKVPFVEGMFERYLKTTDAERSPNSAGGYQGKMMQNHRHEGTIGTLVSSLFGRGVLARLRGLYSTSASGVTDLTGDPVDSTGSVSLGGSDHRPENIGKMGLIIL